MLNKRQHSEFLNKVSSYRLFDAYGIPFHVEIKTGFLHQVAWILTKPVQSLIRVIKNGGILEAMEDEKVQVASDNGVKIDLIEFYYS